jgi:hypothetical protein
MMRSFLVLSLVSIWALSGCRSSSQLPKFAEPTGGAIDPATLRDGDRIAYRTISPSDFRATAPPPDMKKYAERMGAVTCAHVFTEPDPVYYIEQTPDGFRGAYERLSFVAKMDRECSWWNPKKGQVPEEYILQHEQIHFALAESAARRLDTQAKKIVAELRPAGSSQKSVEKVLVGTVEVMMEKAMKDLMDRNLAFDRDTSNTYAPEKQQAWYDEVMAELR